jgi:hypothetical protein
MTGACGLMPIHRTVGFSGAGQSELASKDKSAVGQKPTRDRGLPISWTTKPLKISPG